MFNDDSNPTLTSVTFGGNSASLSGGGIANVYSSSLKLANCILWGNLDQSGTGKMAQIYNDDSIINVTYSLVQSAVVYTGTGNLNVDPLFVRNPDDSGDGWGNGNDDYGDLHLQPTSPAIDAGDNINVTVSTDLDGKPRFLDVAARPDVGNGTPPIVDMGAYEAAWTELRLLKSVTPTVAAPGDTVTYTLTFSNEGSLPATGVVITDTIPVNVTNTSVISSGVAVTQSSPGYVWTVENLAPGNRGTITITGVFSGPLEGGTFTNTATIACIEAEVSVGNNKDAAQVRINAAPIANAGVDQIVDTYIPVTLDGSNSYDPDGDIPLAYGWKQAGGANVTIHDALSVTTFAAPGSFAILTFTLSVTDTLGLVSAPDTVVITIAKYEVYLPLVLKDSGQDVMARPVTRP
jgi:uncharacterized repeat protein (TIGR01451 family)